MNSLRTRLLLVVLVVITGFWLLWSCLLVAYMTREQSGWRDKVLRDIANQVLTSLPESVAQLSSESGLLTLPGDAEFSSDKMSFQIWALPDDRILRSVESPESPLRADFGQGFSVEEVEGRRWRVYAVSDAGGRIQVQTGKPLELFQDSLHKWTKVALAVALLIFAILGVTLKVVLWRSLRPVTCLQEAIARREDYNLEPLSTSGLPSEIRPLVESFNRLLGRIDRAVDNERQLIADAAHELRTPMAAVQTQAQVALYSNDQGETRKALQSLISAVERGTRLSQQLLDSARLEANQGSRRELLDLADPVSLVTHGFEGLARNQHQTIALNTCSCQVLGDMDELGILIHNLLDNALRYSGQGSRIEVCCDEDSLRGGAILTVSDSGPGIPDPAEREHIFERFFRASDNTQRGSGIGLSLVRRIAQSHGAPLNVGDGLEGRGLSISVTFPPVSLGESVPQ